MKGPNVHLLAGPAVAREATDEVVVARPGDGEGIVAASPRGVGGGCVARVEVLVGHPHHVVELLVVLEHYKIKFSH